jgi:hypothetical protein
MSKKEKEERKIYRDFTLSEFDVFTMELQSEGAAQYKGEIIAALERRKGHIVELAMAIPAGKDQAALELDGLIAGIEVAIGYIENMPGYEDIGGCSECGAF